MGSTQRSRRHHRRRQCSSNRHRRPRRDCKEGSLACFCCVQLHCDHIEGVFDQGRCYLLCVNAVLLCGLRFAWFC